MSQLIKRKQLEKNQSALANRPALHLFDPLLDPVDEDDQDYYSEIFIDELQSGDAGSVLEQAAAFCQDFEQSKVELSSITQGYLLCRRGHGMMSKVSKRYFQIISNQGVLVKFDSPVHCSQVHAVAPDFYNMPKKA